MADEDISLNEDQLLENLDDGNNGDSEFLNEVNIHFDNIMNHIFTQISKMHPTKNVWLKNAWCIEKNFKWL